MLRLTRLTPALFKQVVLWHKAWGARLGAPLTPPPEPPAESIVVVDEDGDLVAFLALYPTQTFIFGEWAIARPGLPPRAAHQAAEVVAEEFMRRAAASGKMAAASPRTRGIAMVLRRFGFRNSYCPMFVAHAPSVPVTTERPPCLVPKKRKRRSRSGSRASSRASTRSSQPEDGEKGDGTPTPS